MIENRFVFNYKNLCGRSAGQDHHYFSVSYFYLCLFLFESEFIRQSHDYYGDNAAAMTLR